MTDASVAFSPSSSLSLSFFLGSSSAQRGPRGRSLRPCREAEKEKEFENKRKAKKKRVSEFCFDRRRLRRPLLARSFSLALLTLPLHCRGENASFPGERNLAQPFFDLALSLSLSDASRDPLPQLCLAIVIGVAAREAVSCWCCARAEEARKKSFSPSLLTSRPCPLPCLFFLFFPFSNKKQPAPRGLAPACLAGDVLLCTAPDVFL